MKIYYLGISMKKLDCCLVHNGQGTRSATIRRSYYSMDKLSFV